MVMKIGIVQVDGDLPNLALMQICGYHESLGDSVEWWEGPLFNDQVRRNGVAVSLCLVGLRIPVVANDIIVTP